MDSLLEIDPRGNMIVVSAPSGAGKSSVVELALTQIDRLRYSISCTTRKPRDTERHGVDYYFISDDEFQGMIERGEFFEWAEVHGNLYGTPASAILAALSAGDDVILDIDVEGAAQVVKKYPEAVTIFILPPSLQVMETRLLNRNQNTPDDVARRLRNATAEVQYYGDFKYIVVNDELEQAVTTVCSIILAERHRSDRMHSLARRIVQTFGGDSTDD